MLFSIKEQQAQAQPGPLQPPLLADIWEAPLEAPSPAPAGSSSLPQAPAVRKGLRANPLGLPVTEAAAARFAWSGMFKQANDPEEGTVEERKRLYLNLRLDRGGDSIADFFRATVKPARQGAALLMSAKAGEGLIGGSICITAAAVPPAVPSGPLEQAIRAMHAHLRQSLRPANFLPRGALADMQAQWVKAMARMPRGERDDWLRGGARNQTGFAQGVCDEGLPQFDGLPRAPKEFGGLMWPRARTEDQTSDDNMHVHTCCP